MAYVYKNPNPIKNLVGDCVVRGISILINKPWEYVYTNLVTKGLEMFDMPSSNEVWSAYLRSLGYEKFLIPNTCPDCYTVKDFCYDNRRGKYLLATGDHVVAVINGDYFDTWNSGNEIPIYYFTKKGSDIYGTL